MYREQEPEISIPMPPKGYSAPRQIKVQTIVEEVEEKKDENNSPMDSIKQKLAIAKKQRETLVQRYFSRKEEEDITGIDHLTKMRDELESKISFYENQLKNYN